MEYQNLSELLGVDIVSLSEVRNRTEDILGFDDMRGGYDNDRLNLRVDRGLLRILGGPLIGQRGSCLLADTTYYGLRMCIVMNAF